MTGTSSLEKRKTSPRPRRRKRFVGLVLAGFILGLGLGWVIIQLSSGWELSSRTKFYGGLIQSPEPAANFTLRTQSGDQVQIRDFENKVVLLYFGYTYCPDICPATMFQLAKATQALTDQERALVQVIMVTVDGERDTPELLANYLEHFDPSFIGLTGTEEEIARAASGYGVFYERQESDSDAPYLVNHTASVFVVDRHGDLRMIYPFDTPGENVASDLRLLVREEVIRR